jgi:hypothetical protein
MAGPWHVECEPLVRLQRRTDHLSRVRIEYRLLLIHERTRSGCSAVESLTITACPHTRTDRVGDHVFVATGAWTPGSVINSSSWGSVPAVWTTTELLFVASRAEVLTVRVRISPVIPF